jgi:glycine cleavage system H protein
MTVLLVILFFATFVLIDYAATRREEARAAARLAAAPPTDEPVWVAGYELPEALHFHRGHTWARRLADGTVSVGLDDFARRLLGRADYARLPAVGDWVRQGAQAFRLRSEARSAALVSPVEGEVVGVNRDVLRQPALVTDEPYGRGWIFRVRPTHLAESLRNLLSGRLARRWMEDSREALELRLMALSGSVLQDGGEPAPDFARHLQAEDWARLRDEFLLS